MQAQYKKWLSKDKLVVLQGWARDGLTDEQIAQNIGIRRETLYTWKKKYPNINNALKKGKEVVDYAVESRLLKNALEGDTTAMIFWLKNRRPDKWRDRKDINADVDAKVNDPFKDLSTDELRKLANSDES